MHNVEQGLAWPWLHLCFSPAPGENTKVSTVCGSQEVTGAETGARDLGKWCETSVRGQRWGQLISAFRFPSSEIAVWPHRHRSLTLMNLITNGHFFCLLF